jgi:hypothetical protein
MDEERAQCSDRCVDHIHLGPPDVDPVADTAPEPAHALVEVDRLASQYSLARAFGHFRSRTFFAFPGCLGARDCDRWDCCLVHHTHPSMISCASVGSSSLFWIADYSEFSSDYLHTGSSVHLHSPVENNSVWLNVALPNQPMKAEQQTPPVPVDLNLDVLEISAVLAGYLVDSVARSLPGLNPSVCLGRISISLEGWVTQSH